MNTIGLFFQSMNKTGNFVPNASGSRDTENALSFEGLLLSEQLTSTITMDNITLEDISEDLINVLQNIFNLISDDKDLEEQLENIISENILKEDMLDNILSLINDSFSENELMYFTTLLAEEMKINHNNKDSLEEMINHLLKNNIAQTNFHNSVFYMAKANQTELIEPEQIREGFQSISREAESIIRELMRSGELNPDESSKDVSRLLKLLETYTKLEDIHGKNNKVFEGESVNNREEKVWQQLVKLYQNRSQLVSKQQYSRKAQVTTTDISKWLSAATEVQEDVVVRQQSIPSSNTLMSKTEQHVIHVNQNQNSQLVDQQIIDRFQSIITKSNFLNRPGGINQLSIALKPDNLGEMVVRLTQINGEMTVKIIVTSTATRKMLETNIHQLKGMFSPQQVVIEKQDVDMLKLHDDQEEQTMDQQHSEEHNQDKQENDQEDDGEFALQFEQLLNEKV